MKNLRKRYLYIRLHSYFVHSHCFDIRTSYA